ncbi:MAG: CotH kinase family protein [Firmicutes bacterium]|nr:CotH kinase family protein [Bacillota bacterium]
MNRKIIIAIVCLLCLIGVAVYLFTHSQPQQQREVMVNEIAAPVAAPSALTVNPSIELTFSYSPGFYTTPFRLTISGPEGAVIHYTLDGSPPTTSSPRHTSPIRINPPVPSQPVTQFDNRLTSRVTVYSINAVAVMGNEISEVVTANFVAGSDVDTRFCENTLIFALNSDPHGLFDHYDGILVEGVDRERFRQEFFVTHGRWPTRGYAYGYEMPASPANFNRRGIESERPVHVQVFDNEGTLHISQRAGVRVRGGFSRAHPQKSLELFAREEYGDRNNFPFAFFTNEFTHDGRLIDRYRRVRLRNGGSDRNAGFIRDELSQTLFRQAGHSDTQTHRPAAVFLNGEYYGVAWLKTPRTPNHLRRRYGGVTANFEIVAGGDNRFIPSRWHGEYRASRDLLQVSELAMAGFVGEGGQARFEEFSRRIDVDSLIRYYAMQIFINNYDWPNHNIEMWRYFPTEDELNDPYLHPYLHDGRWRVFAHDVESAWAMWDDYDRMAREDTLRDILTGENDRRWNSSHSSAFLYALLGREDTKAQFANTVVDLIEGAFATDNVIRVLDGLISQIQNELHQALRMDIFYPGNPWWPSTYSMGYSHEAIRRFARLRPDYMLASVYANLGFNRTHRFELTVTTGQGGGVMMNSRPVPQLQTAVGNYFAGTTVTVTARPYPGYALDHWIVNGVRHDGDTITIGEDSNVTVYFTSARGE